MTEDELKTKVCPDLTIASSMVDHTMHNCIGSAYAWYREGVKEVKISAADRSGYDRMEVPHAYCGKVGP